MGCQLLYIGVSLLQVTMSKSFTIPGTPRSQGTLAPCWRPCTSSGFSLCRCTCQHCSLVGGTTVQHVHVRNSNRRFDEFFDYALAARTEAMGTPHAERRVVWILQQGRAPHRIWLDTPLTPGIQQATQLLQGTGLFDEPFELFDAGSTAQTTAAAIFLALPPHATYWTFVVSDPIAALSYGMIHLAPGSVVNLEAIPAPEGMTYRSPVHICQGAHFMLCSRERVLAERPPSEATSSGHPRRPPAGGHGANPDPDAGASSGTSLVQLSFPPAARRQIIFDSVSPGSSISGQSSPPTPAPPLQPPCANLAPARGNIGQKLCPNSFWKADPVSCSQNSAPFCRRGCFAAAGCNSDKSCGRVSAPCGANARPQYQGFCVS